MLKNNILFMFPDYRNFFIARVISLIGDSFATIAVTWWIVGKGTEESKLQLGLMLATIILPKAVIGPFFGVLVDRFSRKKCMLYADGLRAVLAVLLAIMMQLDKMTMPLMYLICFMIALFAPLFEAAESASLMNITSAEYVGRASALHSTAFNISNLFGLFMGASIVALVGVNAAFWFNALSFVLSYIFVLQIKNNLPAPEKKQQTTPWENLKQGMVYLFANKPIFYFLLFTSALNFVATPFLMAIPLLVKFVYHENVIWVAVLEGSLAVGSLLAGVVLAHHVWKWSVHATAIWTLMVCSILVAAIGTIGNKVGAAFFFFLIGIGLTLINTQLNAQFQLVISDEYKGRFFALNAAMAMAIMPVGYALSGILAGEMPVTWMLIGVGAVIFVMSLLMNFLPEMKRDG